MNTLISLFIDDELDLEEKCDFVKTVRHDESFFLESMDLLQQEMLIRSDVVDHTPQAVIDLPGSWMSRIRKLFRPAVLIPAVLAGIILMLVLSPTDPVRRPQQLNRFVIYQPDVDQVEITGSFTGWKRIPMVKIGTSGYWEARFPLSEGEYRYTYIIEGSESVADPTVPATEEDDFGGMNSIIRVVNNV